MKKITFISDTHSQHDKITPDLPGGDFLIHSGDVSNRGSRKEIEDFLTWFESIKNYKHKIFIAGNHDFYFEEKDYYHDYKNNYPSIEYLDRKQIELEGLKIYGSPITPYFHNWAFNVHRKSKEMYDIVNEYPSNVDILITHGPPQSILDTSGHPYNTPLLGCEVLYEKLPSIKPKVHVFGHIHGGYGMIKKDDTLFINASVLNEQYQYVNKPINIEL